VTDDPIETNRRHWDELAALHPDTDFYDVEGFRAGGSTLDPVVVEGVGDVAGTRLLHLQCHFGLDTLSWLRAGAAAVVGVDFSATAVETARDLARETGLADRATFVESDVYALPETLDRADGFDVVFASHGALCWLPDLTEWAAVAAHFCRPGGRLFVADSHPLSHVIQDLRLDDDGAVRSDWPYFSDDPLRFDEEGSYADADADLAHTETVEWSHTLGEVVTAVARAGFVVDELREYPYTAWEQYPGRMTRRDDGYWAVSGEDYPLLFSLSARMPE
jgi:SAM-dependent methyltransferase